MSAPSVTQPQDTVHVDLGGRTALVTGAGSDIGRATALRLARSGSHVVALDLKEEPVREVAAAIGGQALVADLSDLGALDALDLRADIVVNCAGIQHVRSVEEFAPEQDSAAGTEGERACTTRPLCVPEDSMTCPTGTPPCSSWSTPVTAAWPITTPTRSSPHHANPAKTRPTRTGSTFHHMKELRPGSAGSSEIRMIFAFDPVREAVFLVAGDKSGQWQSWYRTAIPLADARFEEHLTRLKEEQP